MFLNSCPWNRHTLAWRGISYRLRIRQGTKVITCVQAVTHAAFTVYVCANCRLFYLYHFSVWFWHLRVYLLFEGRLFRLKLLEDTPLSRVQIIHIRTVCCWPQSIHSSMPSRSIFLSLSGRPASLHVRLLLPVVTLGARMSPVPMTATPVVLHW